MNEEHLTDYEKLLEKLKTAKPRTLKERYPKWLLENERSLKKLKGDLRHYQKERE